MTTYAEQREAFKAAVIKAIPGSSARVGSYPDVFSVVRDGVAVSVRFDAEYDGMFHSLNTPVRIAKVLLPRVNPFIKARTIRAKDGVVSVDKVVAGIVLRLEAEEKDAQLRLQRKSRESIDNETARRILNHNKEGSVVSVDVDDDSVILTLKYLTEDEASALLETLNSLRHTAPFG